jgi:ribonuclease E
MSQESAALAVMRSLQVACSNDQVSQVNVSVAPKVSHNLSNAQRGLLSELEIRTSKKIIVSADSTLSENDVHITCTDQRGAPVAWDAPAPTTKGDIVETVEIQKVLEEEADAGRPEAEEPPAESTEGAEDEKTEKKRRRRGKRGGRKHRKKTDESAEKQDSSARGSASDEVGLTTISSIEEMPVKVLDQIDERTEGPSGKATSDGNNGTSLSEPSDGKLAKGTTAEKKGEAKKPRRRGSRGGRKRRTKKAKSPDTTKDDPEPASKASDG